MAGNFSAGQEIGLEVTGYPMEDSNVTDTSGHTTGSNPQAAAAHFVIPPWVWIFVAILLGYFGMRLLVSDE